MNVLVIDDNPGDVRLLREALDEIEAHVNILVAKDGAEGIDILFHAQRTRKWQPDLVLLDLNLPKISGHDVLMRIKNNPATRQIPVIVFTSSRAEADIRRAYEAHANAYMRKPTTLDDLMVAARGLKTFWLETACLPSSSANL